MELGCPGITAWSVFTAEMRKISAKPRTFNMHVKNRAVQDFCPEL